MFKVLLISDKKQITLRMQGVCENFLHFVFSPFECLWMQTVPKANWK